VKLRTFPVSDGFGVRVIWRGLVVAVVRLGDGDGEALVGLSEGLGPGVGGGLEALLGTVTVAGGDSAAVYSTPRTPAHEMATPNDVAAAQAAM